MGTNAIKVFISPSCEPCHDIQEMIRTGQFSTNVDTTDLELVDVESEEGFPQIESEAVKFVPTARYRGKACELQILEDDTLFIACPDPAEESTGLESPSSTHAE